MLSGSHGQGQKLRGSSCCTCARSGEMGTALPSAGVSAPRSLLAALHSCVRRGLDGLAPGEAGSARGGVRNAAEESPAIACVLDVVLTDNSVRCCVID